MARIIIDVPDSELVYYRNSTDIFVDIIRNCDSVNNPIGQGAVVTYSLRCVCESCKHSES